MWGRERTCSCAARPQPRNRRSPSGLAGGFRLLLAALDAETACGPKTLRPDFGSFPLGILLPPPSTSAAVISNAACAPSHQSAENLVVAFRRHASAGVPTGLGMRSHRGQFSLGTFWTLSTIRISIGCLRASSFSPRSFCTAVKTDGPVDSGGGRLPPKPSPERSIVKS